MHVDNRAALTAARALAAVSAAGMLGTEIWHAAVDIGEATDQPINREWFEEVLSQAEAENLIIAEHDFANDIGKRYRLAPGGAETLRRAITDAERRLGDGDSR